MKSHSSSLSSAEFFDGPRSSDQNPERLRGTTGFSASRFEPSLSESAPNAARAARRAGRQRCGISFHFLILLSLSCCALLRFRGGQDEFDGNDEAA